MLLQGSLYIITVKCKSIFFHKAWGISSFFFPFTRTPQKDIRLNCKLLTWISCLRVSPPPSLEHTSNTFNQNMSGLRTTETLLWIKAWLKWSIRRGVNRQEVFFSPSWIIKLTIQTVNQFSWERAFDRRRDPCNSLPVTSAWVLILVYQLWAPCLKEKRSDFLSWYNVLHSSTHMMCQVLVWTNQGAGSKG